MSIKKTPCIHHTTVWLYHHNIHHRTAWFHHHNIHHRTVWLCHHNIHHRTVWLYHDNLNITFIALSKSTHLHTHKGKTDITDKDMPESGSAYGWLVDPCSYRSLHTDLVIWKTGRCLVHDAGEWVGQRCFVFPTDLTPFTCRSVLLTVHLSSFIQVMCPAHFHFISATYWTMSVTGSLPNDGTTGATGSGMDKDSKGQRQLEDSGRQLLPAVEGHSLE